MDDKDFLAGAAAFTAGSDHLTNPFLQPRMCPQVTGETIENWVEKVFAWDRFWMFARKKLRRLDQVA